MHYYIRRYLVSTLFQLPDMDASLYYTDITPDVDLLLQNVTFTVNRPRNNDIDTNLKIATPSSSTDIKKSVTFEDDDVFTLYNINLSIQKVRINFIQIYIYIYIYIYIFFVVCV